MKTIKAGERIYWRGDFSNAAKFGTVQAVDGAWMFVRWDGEDSEKPVPVGVVGATMSVVEA